MCVRMHACQHAKNGRVFFIPVAAHLEAVHGFTFEGNWSFRLAPKGLAFRLAPIPWNPENQVADFFMSSWQEVWVEILV